MELTVRLFVVALFMTLLSNALGHSYLTKPISRSNQLDSTTGCRGPSCLGPCDATASHARAPITIARGASVEANWPRNNHAGGFIRFAWAPTAQSDSHSAFDSNVQQVNCHEVGGCHPDDASDPDGGDSGPADGSSRACSSSFTVPLDLTDGLWTLQWAWFGGAFTLGDYYSCVDYKISGGPTGASVDPIFIGGDFSYPGQNKCKFFNTNQLHKCINEPCNNPIFPSAQDESGPAAGYSSVVTPSTTGSKPPSTTGSRPAPVPSTTGSRPTPSTTGSRPAPTPSSTTGNTPVSLTTANVPVQPLTSGSSGNNTCSGRDQKCYDSTHYQVCFNGQFAPPQACQSGLICQKSPSTGGVYCTRPGETIKEVNSASKITNSLLCATISLLVIFLTL